MVDSFYADNTPPSPIMLPASLDRAIRFGSSELVNEQTSNPVNFSDADGVYPVNASANGRDVSAECANVLHALH